jgi:hypothetical protein
VQPATDTTLAGAALTGSQIESFSYVGSDQRLYQLIKQDNPWQVIDVFSLWQSTTGITLPFPRPGTGARGDGPIAMFALEPTPGAGGVPLYGDVIYLCYIDQNSHVQALPYPLIVSTDGLPKGATIASAWNPDLTERTGAPPAAADSGIACHGWTTQGSQHVVYVGTDGNVWELYWVPGQNDDVNGGLLWQANNLSVRTGFTGVLAPKRNGPLAATMFQRENTEHVIYIAGDNTIRELYFYNNSWGGNNLTEASGATPPAANSPLVTFACDYEDTLHVCYLGTDGAVHELWWQQSGWQPDHTISDHPSAAGVKPPDGLAPASGTALAGYVCEYEKSHHVLYTDINNEIVELYRIGGAWNYSILASSGGSGAKSPLSTASPLAGYSTEYDKSEHVIYLDSLTRAQELYRANNQWNIGETSG